MNRVNPYNFVPFGRELPETRDKNDIYRGKDQTELLSGWLDVDLLIKSPLIIPDGAHPKYFDIENQKYVEKKKDVRKSNKLHIEYDFLQMYNPERGRKEYSIAGSELRGMIRSAYETVTNSCVPFLMNDKSMSQRVPLFGALKKRGLLNYDGKKWVLYSTENELEEVVVVPIYKIGKDYYTESLDEVKKNTGQDLEKVEQYLQGLTWKNKKVNYSQTIDKADKNSKIIHYLFIRLDGTAVEKEMASKVIKNRNEETWLQYNVPVDRSKLYHVAYLKKKDSVYEWENSNPYKGAYEKLKSVLAQDGASIQYFSGSFKKHLRDSLNSNSDISNEIEDKVKKDISNFECSFALEKALDLARTDKKRYVPVYYFIVEDHNKKHVYLSNAAAGRIAQRRRWKEIMSYHVPCENKLCPACLLFGTINGEKMKGHLRVTDAFVRENSDPKRSVQTLQVLSSPRTSAFEFYLEKPEKNATYWNFDFYGVTETIEGENKTNYYHLDKAMPRGRKMYWHHKISASGNEKTKLNSTMESLDDGSFSFKIFFDQITEQQLADLIWVITLGENNENSRYQHKLGHAKPFGYGSVKLLVKDGKIRKFKAADGKYSYSLEDLSSVGIEKNNINPSFDTSSEIVNDLLIMCNSETIGENIVDYPRLKDNGKIFEWFAENRKNPKTLKVLPKPDEDDQTI